MSSSDSAPPTKARGYGISDTKKYTEFSVQEFDLKTAGPRDVTIAIDFCGVCGSDMHTVTGGWGERSAPWVCPGHEIVGKVVHVGADAGDEFKVGSIAGVGAQVFSCLKCDRCKNDNENYCPHQVDTYNAKFPDGVLAQGGYSSMIRTDKQFVFNIPGGLKPEHAAPMLCAGATVYSPLKRNGCGPGKLVGIVGMGGLGHFAVQFAKAMGAEVVVFSHSANKEADALKLGADKFVNTGDKGFSEAYGVANGGREFDFILSCADANAIPLSDFLSFMKVHGKVTTVGLPDADQMFEMNAMGLAENGAAFGGSHIGSKKEIIELLDIAAKHDIKPWIHEILPMSRAGEAIEAVKTNKVRYRYVLKQDLE